MNLDVDPRGGVFSRAGYKKKHTTQVSGNWNPKDLFNYKDPVDPRILLTTGFVDQATPIYGKIYSSTGGNFTTLNTSSVASLNVYSENGASITQWQDDVYLAIGKDASNMYKWNKDDTYVTSLLASGPIWQKYELPVGGYMPRAEHARSHANKLFVANTKELNDEATPSLVDHPNRLRWSHENRPEDWFQDDYIDIIAGGEGIRGLAIVDGQLLIFKPKAVYLLLGYDADSFQLVELSTNIGIEYPQHVVEGNGGAFFFDYPGGLYFFNRNGIQSIFDRLKPAIDTNRINANRQDKISLSYVNDRLWMSAPFDFNPNTTAATSNPTGSVVDYANINFVFDPSIGRGGAFTMYQSATWYASATPVELDGYGLLSGTDWTDANGEIWHLMIHPDENFKYIMYVDEYDYLDDIPQNAHDDIIEGDEMGDFQTIYTTAWFYDDRYVQTKTFVRSLYVVRPVDKQTQITVGVYHNFNSERQIRSSILNLKPISSGSTWGTGVWGTATFGESDLKTGMRRGGRLKKAKAVQLKFQGPSVNLIGALGPDGRQWGINSIGYKFKRRRIKSSK